jgi:hypothetical protein
MTNYEYRKKALVFERPGMTQAQRLDHAILGILSELFAELPTAKTRTNINEEVGDVLWFCALAEDAVNLPEDYAVDERYVSFDHLVYIGSVADAVKAAHIYGKPLPTDIAVRVASMTHEIHNYIDFTYFADFDECRLANLRKLAKRYIGGKFTFESALMRDVAAEYAAMEGEG